MSRDKQIKATMYDDVYAAIEHNAVIDVIHGGYIGIDTGGLTKELYDDGYRKASDVAREIFEEIEKALEQAKEIADIRIRELAPYTYKVMREAGKLYHKHDSNAIAELKKKHTGEDTNVTTEESEKDDG